MRNVNVSEGLLCIVQNIQKVRKFALRNGLDHNGFPGALKNKIGKIVFFLLRAVTGAE